MSLTNLKIIIKEAQKYFSGGKIQDVELFLEKNYSNPLEFENDFYLSTIDDLSPEIVVHYVRLFIMLGVERNLWDKYMRRDLSIYAFLVELTKDHEDSIQLNQLIALLDKKKQKHLMEVLTKLVLELIIPIIILCVYFELDYLAIYDYLILSAHILPILGIVFSLSALGINLYLNHLNQARSEAKIFRDDVYLIINCIFNVTAKILLLCENPVMAPIASGFFITAQLVLAYKELYYYLELKQKYDQLDKQDNPNELVKIRDKHDYIKQRNVLTINLIEALTLTASLIGFCFIPSGILLTTCTLATMAGVYLIKQLALKINEDNISSRLQNALIDYNNQNPNAIDEKVDSLLKKPMKINNASEIKPTSGKKAEPETAADKLKPKTTSFKDFSEENRYHLFRSSTTHLKKKTTTETNLNNGFAGSMIGL